MAPPSAFYIIPGNDDYPEPEKYLIEFFAQQNARIDGIRVSAG
jgi:hypothetical protein